MMVLPGVTAGTRFFAKRSFASLFVTRHALIVKRIHAVRQRCGVRIEMTGIAGRLGSSSFAGQQFVTLVTTFQFLLVHLGVTAFALGVNGIAQGRRGSVGLFAMTLIARARFGFDIRVMVTIGTARCVLLRVVVMAVRELAQFSMMAAGTGLLRQGRLVVRGELGVKFRRVA
jgi:hypothetical protein